jgi:hypothetical protein
VAKCSTRSSGSDESGCGFLHSVRCLKGKGKERRLAKVSREEKEGRPLLAKGGS